METNKLNMNWIEQEYTHLTSELARYENTSQRLISIVSIMLTLVFAFGEKYSFDYAFPFIPIISIIALQYLITNNYAYRVRELYLIKLEGEHAGFYSSQISNFYKGFKWWESILLPFNSLIITVVLILLIISIFSFINALEFLKNKDFNSCHYWLVNIGFWIYFTISTIWSLIKLSKKAKEMTIDNKTTPHNTRS
jgi:hypothetical protein